MALTKFSRCFSAKSGRNSRRFHYFLTCIFLSGGERGRINDDKRRLLSFFRFLFFVFHCFNSSSHPDFGECVFPFYFSPLLLLYTFTSNTRPVAITLLHQLGHFGYLGYFGYFGYYSHHCASLACIAGLIYYSCLEEEAKEKKKKK